LASFAENKNLSREKEKPGGTDPAEFWKKATARRSESLGAGVGVVGFGTEFGWEFG
jgi:hypothetical protein